MKVHTGPPDAHTGRTPAAHPLHTLCTPPHTDAHTPKGLDRGVGFGQGVFCTPLSTCPSLRPKGFSPLYLFGQGGKEIREICGCNVEKKFFTPLSVRPWMLGAHTTCSLRGHAAPRALSVAMALPRAARRDHRRAGVPGRSRRAAAHSTPSPEPLCGAHSRICPAVGSWCAPS